MGGYICRNIFIQFTHSNAYSMAVEFLIFVSLLLVALTIYKLYLNKVP